MTAFARYALGGMSEPNDDRVPTKTSSAGRPRSGEADRAITAAALRLLAERGPARVTVEGVAEYSGVAKTTIYRRYRNRRELLHASLRSVAELPEPSPLLPTADRLVVLLEQFRQGVESVGLRVVATLFLEAEDPEFAETFRQCVLAPRLELLHRVFQDGVAAGELRPDADYRRVGDLLFGSYFARFAIEGGVDEEWARAVVALALPLVARRPPG